MFEYWIKSDLQHLPVVEDLCGTVFSQDNVANKIGVIVTDGGNAVSLSGTVRAWIIRGDGTTITVDGSKSGNMAWVTLPATAYAVTGRIGIYIKLLVGNDVVTLGGIESYVYKSL